MDAPLDTNDIELVSMAAVEDEVCLFMCTIIAYANI